MGLSTSPVYLHSTFYLFIFYLHHLKPGPQNAWTPCTATSCCLSTLLYYLLYHLSSCSFTHSENARTTNVWQLWWILASQSHCSLLRNRFLFDATCPLMSEIVLWTPSVLWQPLQAACKLHQGALLVLKPIQPEWVVVCLTLACCAWVSHRDAMLKCRKKEHSRTYSRTCYKRPTWVTNRCNMTPWSSGRTTYSLLLNVRGG